MPSRTRDHAELDSMPGEKKSGIIRVCHTLYPSYLRAGTRRPISGSDTGSQAPWPIDAGGQTPAEEVILQTSRGDGRGWGGGKSAARPPPASQPNLSTDLKVTLQTPPAASPNQRRPIPRPSPTPLCLRHMPPPRILELTSANHAYYALAGQGLPRLLRAVSIVVPPSCLAPNRNSCRATP